jgi:hypothetical protein
MFSNEALSIVIGLTFIYLLYSLLGTLIQEILATNVEMRSFMLRKAIRTLLDTKTDSSFSETFLTHPSIKYLRKGNWMTKCPSYLGPERFSKVMIDLLRGKDIVAGASIKEHIEASLKKKELAWKSVPEKSESDKSELEKSVPEKPSESPTPVKINNDTADYLRSIWVDSQGDVQKFSLLLQEWFNGMMDKTTELYKQRTQFCLLGIGFIIAVAFNVDTIAITKKLQSNPKLAEHVVRQANDFVKAHPNMEAELEKSKQKIEAMQIADTSKSALKKGADIQYAETKKLRDSLTSQANALVQNDITKVNDLLGLGWPNGFLTFDYGRSWLEALGGWLLTALAISLGAPFWFSMLNKAMQIRNAVGADEKKGNDKLKSGSEQIIKVG